MGSGPLVVTRPSRARGCLWRAGAAVFVIGGLVALAALAEELDLPRQTEQSLGRVLILVVGGTVLWLLLGRARRHEAEGADEVLARDPRPPVVYLRPFADDATTAQLFGSATEEEQLAEALEDVGPLVAIGKPGEPLPELGAARVYVSDRQWKAKVRKYLHDAALVVLRLGDTEACWWELEQARKQVPPERLLLLVPTGADAEALRLRAGALVRQPLRAPRARPRRLGSLEAFVSFAPDGTPEWLPVVGSFWRTRITRPLTASLRLTLRPVIERATGAWRPPGINVLRVTVVGVFALWLVAMAVLAVAALAGWNAL